MNPTFTRDVYTWQELDRRPNLRNSRVRRDAEDFFIQQFPALRDIPMPGDLAQSLMVEVRPGIRNRDTLCLFAKSFAWTRRVDLVIEGAGDGPWSPPSPQIRFTFTVPSIRGSSLLQSPYEPPFARPPTMWDLAEARQRAAVAAANNNATPVFFVPNPTNMEEMTIGYDAGRGSSQTHLAMWDEAHRKQIRHLVNSGMVPALEDFFNAPQGSAGVKVGIAQGLSGSPLLHSLIQQAQSGLTPAQKAIRNSQLAALSASTIGSPQDLFDALQLATGPVNGAPAVRNEIGKWAEELAARALKLTLTPISNASLCPDFSLGNMRGEIKSVGKSNSGLIYKWRLEKEEAMFGDDYLYVFVRHRVPITLTTREDVIAEFARWPSSIIACTLADVKAAIGGKSPKLFSIHTDPNHGSQREGYKNGGWQFSISRIAWDYQFHSDIAWPAPMRSHMRVTVLTTANWRRVTELHYNPLSDELDCAKP